MRRLVVVGDTLADLDVLGDVRRLAPDGPVPVLDEVSTVARPGGAGLAASLAAGFLQETFAVEEVVLVTALGGDDRAAALRRLLEGCAVRLVDLGGAGTTAEKVRFRGGGQRLLRLDREGTARPVAASSKEALREAELVILSASAVLVSDYGRGVAVFSPLREAIGRTRAPVVWDPHPRGAAPTAGSRLVTPTASELDGFLPPDGDEAGRLAALTHRARQAIRTWQCSAVAVTLGREGALLVSEGGAPLAVPPPSPLDVDPCGAGDCFAAAAALGLGAGAVLSEAVLDAVVAAHGFLCSGGVSSLRLEPPPSAIAPDASRRQDSLSAVLAEISRVRRRGGVVVATGGCFDVLHAGHLSLLRSARALGDHLVVLVNSDSSVQRLKGRGRPVTSEGDRASILRALEVVDSVLVFDDDVPLAFLERLRPDLFVKGGDYAGRVIPEAGVLSRWGGQVVVVPYLDGRSTTGLLAKARS